MEKSPNKDKNKSKAKDKTKDKTEGKGKGKKKEAQMVIRLDKELRDKFVAACQEIDTSASREMRRFMKRFLARYDRGEFDE
ncbi:MAG: hypothetical protein KTR32_39935 [Granulosicoccus sp.]|nr:hypothetical protein [Granulosicoccus sp.]